MPRWWRSPYRKRVLRVGTGAPARIYARSSSISVRKVVRSCKRSSMHMSVSVSILSGPVVLGPVWPGNRTSRFVCLNRQKLCTVAHLLADGEMHHAHTTDTGCLDRVLHLHGLQ